MCILPRGKRRTVRRHGDGRPAQQGQTLCGGQGMEDCQRGLRVRCRRGNDPSRFTGNRRACPRRSGRPCADSKPAPAIQTPTGGRCFPRTPAPVQCHAVFHRRGAGAAAPPRAEYCTACLALNIKKRVFLQHLSNAIRTLAVVGVTGFEPAASCSQSKRATNCATPRLTYIIYYERAKCKVFFSQT